MNLYELAEKVYSKESFICFLHALSEDATAADAEPDSTPKGELNLSPGGDLVEAASHLFAYLRRLDSPGHIAIAVMPIPEHGLGAGVRGPGAESPSP